MRNCVKYMRLVLCVAACPCVFACGGLLDRVEQARSAHEELTKPPVEIVSNMKPSAADLEAEAKRQGLAALLDPSTPEKEASELSVEAAE